MRALHLISSSGLFGAEQMLVNLARVSRVLGHDVQVGVFCNSLNPNQEMNEALKRHGIPARTISCRGRWDRESVEEIRRSVSEYRPDVVHTHGYKADVYGYAAARHRRTPLVATCHNWTESSLALKLYAWADRRVLGRFARVVAVSAELAQRLQKSRVRRVTRIPNGIDVEIFANAGPTLRHTLPDSRALVVGMAARLVKAKGIGTVLKAARAVLQAHPKALFVFVGEGPDRHAFEVQAAELGIRRNVVFAGFQLHMPGVYRSFDIFLLPSLFEGLPMSLLEAMAAGLPVIATAVGGIPELVSDDQTGLLVKPSDVGGLAAAILRLAGDDGLRTRLGAGARGLVKQLYSAERMARDYWYMYREVVEESVAN